MDNIKLKVSNLQKVFPAANRRERDVVALKDLNLEVKESEFVVMVGPSGCGKSTLINIIGGLEDATQGSVQIDGKEVTQPGADRGMVFQGYSLFPWLTVQKNVEFGLKMKKVSKSEIRERVLEIMDLVQLTGFEKRYPSQLSGGQKQRVAIARAYP